VPHEGGIALKHGDAEMIDIITDVDPDATLFFRKNYLGMLQCKADTIAYKIDEFDFLVDDIQFHRNEIADVKEAAGDDGLSADDREFIHDLRDSIQQDLKLLNRLPDLSELVERWDHLNNKIDRHADMWGIDSW
jgi:hypothetical protein